MQHSPFAGSWDTGKAADSSLCLGGLHGVQQALLELELHADSGGADVLEPATRFCYSCRTSFARACWLPAATMCLPTPEGYGACMLTRQRVCHAYWRKCMNL